MALCDNTTALLFTGTQVPGLAQRHYMKSESMRIKEISLRQDPDLRKELALLARGCDFVLPSRFKKRLKAFQQVQVCLSVLIQLSYCIQLYVYNRANFRKYMVVIPQLAVFH